MRTYDYVIVGAGSAGCVLANRLSADPDVRVLLVEAGGRDSDDLIHMPAGFASLYRSRHDWDLSTHHEPFVDRRRIFLPRGRVLGGSSSINAMVYIRGNRTDYDEWRDACGCEGWGYDELLPYFKRAEDNERGPDDHHGVGGPLSVQDGRARSTLCAAWLDAARAIGLRENPDFNGASQDGVGWYQVTCREGLRCCRCLPASRARATQSRGHHALEGHAGGDRARPRDRDRGRAAGRAPAVRRRARGDRLRRRLPVALAEEQDRRSIVEGVRLCEQIAHTEPLARYSERAVFAPEGDSDEEILAYTRATMQTVYHPVGSCKMGVDELAVVDPELRVRGLDALRVVDASVMPTIPRGNTNAPTIAISERAADLIRGREPASAQAAEAAVA